MATFFFSHHRHYHYHHLLLLLSLLLNEPTVMNAVEKGFPISATHTNELTRFPFAILHLNVIGLKTEIFSIIPFDWNEEREKERK